MDQVKIIRVESDFMHGTFGVLLINGEATCVTLEKYWYGNQPYHSCIYPGQFLVVKHTSLKYGWTFKVLGVQGRTDILFHVGNFENDTNGCILLGEKYGVIQGKRCIKNSLLAFQNFMDKLKGVEAFKLNIINEV